MEIHSKMREDAPEGYERPVYVIQEHDATKLHWDLRLEHDGVLKSWAVTKVPPKEPGVRRLAIEVEDHPLGYAAFEGEIPKGNYGAGSVRIWDNGTFREDEWSDDKIVVHIFGEKLRGRYVLIRLKKSESNKNWLFFKGKEK